jgi:hypothetical protein
MSNQMSEAELDAMLIDWGNAARTAAEHHPPATLAAAPRRPRRMGWQLTAGAVAVALAAVTAVGLPKLVDKGDHRPAVSTPATTRTASAPPGFQVVTFHGLSITVPQSWQVMVGGSCTLNNNIVQLPGGAPLCGMPPYLDLTIVEFFDNLPLSVISAARTTETTISGLPATRTEGIEGRRPALAYTVPALHASVLIKPARGKSGEDLAASLQVNEVDVHGCRAKVSPIATLPLPTGTAHHGPAGMLVPSAPVSAIVCRYNAGWLESGNLLTGSALHSFVDTLNSLPPGLSRANNPSLMHCGTQDLNDRLAADLEAYRIEMRYPQGPPMVLFARFGQCGELGISNGIRTAQRTDALVNLLLHTVSAAHGFPSRVVPVK